MLTLIFVICSIVALLSCIIDLFMFLDPISGSRKDALTPTIIFIVSFLIALSIGIYDGDVIENGKIYNGGGVLTEIESDGFSIGDSTYDINLVDMTKFKIGDYVEFTFTKPPLSNKNAKTLIKK